MIAILKIDTLRYLGNSSIDNHKLWPGRAATYNTLSQ